MRVKVISAECPSRHLRPAFSATLCISLVKQLFPLAFSVWRCAVCIESDRIVKTLYVIFQIMATETVTTETITVTTDTLCQECVEAPANYQCPRCNRRTCSLSCCKAHKERTGCTGKRNRTEFLPLARMSDATIRSDYHFLEDVLANIDGGKRLLHHMGAAQNQSRKESVPLIIRPMMELPQVNDDNEPPSKRPRTNRLAQKAEDRGVTLLLMPPGMQRHKSNTSWYHTKTNTFYWKVDFVIHGTPTRVLSVPKLSEHANLSKELAKALPDASNSTRLLIKRLPCRSNSPLYVELDSKTSTLKSALQDMTVIEYPTIEVVPLALLDRFPRYIQEVE